MTLISSGALALKDYGTNPSSSTLLDTGYNAFSLASDTSFSLNQAYRLYYDGEVNAWEYSNDVLVDGTAYVYKKQSTSAYHDSGHTIGIYSATGYSADIGTALELTGQATGYSSQTYVSGIGLNASSSSSLGSLSSSAQTFASPDGNTRTISDFGLCQNTNSDTGYGQLQNKGNIIWFGLVGLVGNTDSAAFYNMTLYDNNGNGITGLTRSSATYEYDGNVSIWTWHNVADSTMNFVNQSNVTRVILTSASAITYNNGISEEMSGGSDTDPIQFSDYYKGGAYHNTTGIPTSGQIAFSEFYGKARVPLTVYSNSGTYGYSAGSQYIPTQSGFNNGFLGSLNSNSFTFQGTTTRIAAILVSYTQLSFGFQNISGTSKQYNNSGWTTLKIWLNQTNNSGTPDRTYYRTSASSTNFSTASTSSTAHWYFSSQANFPTSGGSWYIEVD